ncbi:MAG: energy transducer TonB [Verrucomicrobiota bacterium]
MASIDKEFIKSRDSIWSHLSGLLITSGLFFLIGTTSGITYTLDDVAEEKKPLYYIPPPAPVSEHEASTPKSNRSIESLSIDLAYDEEPVELALDFINVALDPQVNASLALNMDLDRGFQASRPSVGEFDNVVIFERSEVDEKPRLMYNPEPKVPYRLRGDEVVLTMLYFVTEKGRAERISVLDGNTDNPEYHEIAKKSITTWRFRPARRDGKPVNCWVQQIFKFNRGSTSPFSLN